MGDGLREADAKAIGDAIAILKQAGYVVDKTTEGTPTADGVTFELHLHARTAYDRFTQQADVVKAAALDAPEIGIDGTPVEEDADED